MYDGVYEGVFSEKSLILSLWEDPKYASAFVRNGLRIISQVNNVSLHYWHVTITFMDYSNKQWCKLLPLHCSYYYCMAVIIIPVNGKTIGVFLFLS